MASVWRLRAAGSQFSPSTLQSSDSMPGTFTLSHLAGPLAHYFFYLLKFLKRFIIFMSVGILPACTSMYHVPGALGGQKSQIPMLEPQMVVNAMSVPGTELGSSTSTSRAVSTEPPGQPRSLSLVSCTCTACSRIYLQAAEHLAGFFILSLERKTAVNICVQVLVQT